MHVAARPTSSASLHEFGFLGETCKRNGRNGQHEWRGGSASYPNTAFSPTMHPKCSRSRSQCPRSTTSQIHDRWHRMHPTTFTGAPALEGVARDLQLLVQVLRSSACAQCGDPWDLRFRVLYGCHMLRKCARANLHAVRTEDDEELPV